MKTRSEPCTSIEKSTCEPTCLPCDIPPLCRNHYYTGKLLTARDFASEQSYHIDKLRLHQLMQHGWGVVCGLKVKPHPWCPDRRVIVEPGLAVDECGRQIRVPQEVQLELPEKPPPPPESEEPCPPDEEHDRPGRDPGYGQRPRYSGRPSQESRDPRRSDTPKQEPHSSHHSAHGAPADEPGLPEHHGKESQEHGHESPSKDRPERPYRDPKQEECGPNVPLYVCLRYCELETEHATTPFDECCGEANPRPNRICESFTIEILTEKPEDLCRPECVPWDCEGIYREALEQCPEPRRSCCLLLATIDPYTPGGIVTEEAIDNLSQRHFLPSVSRLDQIVRCILDKMPHKRPVRIIDIGWMHDCEYRMKDFLSLFVGEHDDDRGFEVTFEKPVRKDCLSTEVFQAIIVHGGRHGEGRRMQVAPARVWSDADGTRFHLKIDPRFVGECSRDDAFDVYLTLRCDKVVDVERGLQVDGELLAVPHKDGKCHVTPPTGNGIPGGTFESWIHVGD